VKSKPRTGRFKNASYWRNGSVAGEPRLRLMVGLDETRELSFMWKNDLSFRSDLDLELGNFHNSGRGKELWLKFMALVIFFV
jgi:hypothetical protein